MPNDQPALWTRRAERGRRTVEQGPGIEVGAELPLGIGEETLVKLLLFWAEVITANDDRTGREAEIVGALDLCAPEHDSIEQDPQLLKRDFARSGHRVLLNGRQNLVVPEARVLRRGVSTVCIWLSSISSASSLHSAPAHRHTSSCHQISSAKTCTCKPCLPRWLNNTDRGPEKRHTEVKRERIPAQEPDQTVELAHTVLKRRSRQTPPVLRLEFECRLRSIGGAFFDIVGFIKL